MASKEHNLSQYKSNEIPNGTDARICIVISEWNQEITFALRDACIDTLLAHSVSPDNIFCAYVPGAFELPLGTRFALSKQKADAAICLGCVIKGETKHDEYIANAVASGIMSLSLTSGKPIVFGVLTPNSQEQAKERSGGKHGNKGVEAAITALKMIALSKFSKDKDQTIGFNNE